MEFLGYYHESNRPIKDKRPRKGAHESVTLKEAQTASTKKAHKMEKYSDKLQQFWAYMRNYKKFLSTFKELHENYQIPDPIW